MAGVGGSVNPVCGHLVQPGAEFCPACGQPVTGSAAPSPPPAARSPVVPDSWQSTLPPSVSPPAAPLPQSESEPWDSWFAPPRPPAQRGPGPGPSGDLPTEMLGDLRGVPPSGGPRRSRRRLVPVIMAAALVVVAAGVVIFTTHSNGTSANGTSANGTTGTTASASSQPARRQAAVRLSGLLARSVSDRGAVIDAVVDVRRCGPSLHRDERIFARAASSRQHLLSQLGRLPGRSLLPAAMLRDLAGAWRASTQADTDLARWAGDTIAQGCHRDSASHASLRATDVPDRRATAGKQAFASLWNPLARRYGLTAYRWSQL